MSELKNDQTEGPAPNLKMKGRCDTTYWYKSMVNAGVLVFKLLQTAAVVKPDQNGDDDSAVLKLLQPRKVTEKVLMKFIQGTDNSYCVRKL